MKKLPIDYLGAFGSTVGDVYFPQTTLLLPFDGSNGATTTSDLSNTNASVTFSSGDEIRTAQSKFGNSSLYVADNVTISSSDGFNMGTGEFTIEGWWYFTSFSNSFGLYDQWSGSSSGNSQIWHSPAAAGKIKWYYSGGSIFTSNTTMSTGQWYHVAFVRESGTLKMYFNGTVDSSTQSFSGQYGKTDTVYLGDQHAGGGGAPQYYVDDLRVTKGLARYTGNFTPPTTAHLTSAGDVNKQIIVNSAADGVAIGTGGINQTRIAKAWVNFNGTSTVAIRESYNISSLVDRGTGLYSLNLSTNLSSVECAGAGSGTDQDTGTGTSQRNRMVTIIPESTSLVYVNGFDTSGSADDLQIATAIIFGN
jgi:hypothetical protein